MSPSATESVVNPDEIKTKKVAIAERPAKFNLGVPQGEELPELRTAHREPLRLSGALDKFESFDVTPVIGREYINVNLVDLLRAPDSDDLLRDLAITSTNPSSPFQGLH